MPARRKVSASITVIVAPVSSAKRACTALYGPTIDVRTTIRPRSALNFTEGTLFLAGITKEVDCRVLGPQLHGLPIDLVPIRAVPEDHTTHNVLRTLALTNVKEDPLT